jgi:DNA-binding NarL/FixJ family response regulator
MTVFMADDPKVIRDRLRDLITKLDQVEVIGGAENGGQAIDSIVRLGPDVVIVDIRMPEGSGISALEAIKRVKSDVVVIMLTQLSLTELSKAVCSCTSGLLLG